MNSNINPQITQIAQSSLQPQGKRPDPLTFQFVIAHGLTLVMVVIPLLGFAKLAVSISAGVSSFIAEVLSSAWIASGCCPDALFHPQLPPVSWLRDCRDRGLLADLRCVDLHPVAALDGLIGSLSRLSMTGISPAMAPLMSMAWTFRQMMAAGPWWDSLHL